MTIPATSTCFALIPARSRETLRILSACKTACAVFVLCVAAAIASPAQTYNRMWSFNGPNGANPQYGSLVQGRNGSFYGTTSAGGGAHRQGTIFKITPEGKLTKLYSFCSQANCVDGANPWSGLTLAIDGNFYGTTPTGGLYNAGTIFRISPLGVFTSLYSFCAQTNCPDGSNPFGPLVQLPNGNFFGTTLNGGTGINCWYVGCGTAFKFTPSGVLTTLHSFCNKPDCTDGAFPNGLVLGTDGRFYGTTQNGGGNPPDMCGHGCGTIFSMTTTGALARLHIFYSIFTEGSNPTSALIQGTDGNFYGTTSMAAFMMTPAGQVTPLHPFGYGAGGYPMGPLTQATDGNFYGLADDGGSFTVCYNGCGTIFQLTSQGAATTLHAFDLVDGECPAGGLLQGTNGIFYGTTFAGGNSGDGDCSDGISAPGDGVVFSLDMGLGPFVNLVPTTQVIGKTVGILGQGFLGTTGVSFNGTPATFTVNSDTYIAAKVPAGVTDGLVTVVTPSGTRTSNLQFRLAP